MSPAFDCRMLRLRGDPKGFVTIFSAIAPRLSIFKE